MNITPEHINTFFMIVGILRFVLKPFMSLLTFISTKTPTKKDDIIMTKIKRSSWYNIVVYLVDWLFSLKIK